jgi:NDP-mannose synthase
MRAIILAGGKGTRLRPFTMVLPKPLMPIGDKPILEVVLHQLRRAGVDRATMAVGHLSELLEAFFRDGSRFGLHIDYSFEEEPLGTVGPLTLIDGLDDTFMVLNGDILTDLDFADVVRYHRAKGASLTIASYVREVKIDFGVIETDADDILTGYVEKPQFDYRVSMGVYVFEPSVLRLLKKGERFDLPDLVKLLIARGGRVASYAFSGYWLDMGRPDDYATANEEFESRRDHFLGGDQ